MIKKSHNVIYHIVMNNEKEVLEESVAKKNLVAEKYKFKIKYITKTSEFLYNFNLPRYTQCFYAMNTLFIILEHIQYPIEKIANAVYFLLPENINEKDILLVYDYIKNFDNFENKIKSLKLQEGKKDTKSFMVRSYLFEEKIKKTTEVTGFEKLMLKSRRVIFKIKDVKIKNKDIDYLLTKGF